MSQGGSRLAFRHAAMGALGATLMALFAFILLLSAPAASAADVDSIFEAPLEEEPASEGELPYTSLGASPDSDEGRYIVVLEDSVDHPARVAHAQARRRDGEVNLVYHRVLRGYAAILPKDEVAALRREPNVKYVTADRKVEIASQETPTGIERIGASANEGLRIDEANDLRVNADVAVIDTGIDFEHPDLNVVARTDCVPASEDPETQECTDDAGFDANGHGTHVAGTIGALDNGEGVVGVAPGARLWAVKVLNANGIGWDSWIISAVEWVTAHAAQIEAANMSLGRKGSNQAVAEAIEASAEAGVVYAIAAGNSTADTSGYSPAGNPDAITVSALADYDGKAGGEAEPLKYNTCDEVSEENWGPDDALAGFSNFGEKVNVAAPGVCIRSTVPGGGYGYKSGTSMAAPHVAGAAALLASAENPEDLEDVEAIRATIEEEGSQAWEDTSEDGTQEPLLDVSDEAAFDPADQVAVTVAPEVLSTTEASLRGEVNPGGLETEYFFEYGDTAEYGSKAPASAQSAGSGGEYSTVEAGIEGLEGQHVYHYRVVAVNSAGTFYGADRLFGTTPPDVTSEEAYQVDANSARLRAVFNPEGLPTTYRFEYGTTASYGSAKPAPQPGQAGSGLTDFTANVGIAGLNGGTTYHFRIVATNVAGTSKGEDETFTTPAAAWALQSPPVPTVEESTSTIAAFMGVSCWSGDGCMAVGGYDGPSGVLYTVSEYLLAERWDGSHWEAVPAAEPKPGTQVGKIFNDVSCTSSTSCTAVGYYKEEEEGQAKRFPLIERWNGSDWAVQAAPSLSESGTGILKAVSCVSSDWCMAIGNAEAPVAALWDGEAWSELSGLAQLPITELLSVSCMWPTNCVLGGKGGSVEWDGLDFTYHEVDPPSGGYSLRLRGVSCVSPESCEAVGEYYTGPYTIAPLLASWDGSEWTLQALPEGDVGLPRAVSCSSVDFCIAVSSGYKYGAYVPRVLRWNGEEWALQSASIPDGGPELGGARPQGVSCVGPARCTFVGEDLASLGEAEVLPLAERLRNSPRAATDGATGVDAEGATLRGTVNPEGYETSYQFEYGTTTAYGSKVPGESEDAGSGTSNVAVSGAVSGFEPNTTYHFRLVASNEAGTDYGEDRTFTTTPEWTLQSTPSPGTNARLNAVSCASAKECVAVGQEGGAPFGARWDASKGWSAAAWNSTSTPGGGKALSDISCVSSSFCLAVSTTTLSVQRWNGSTWTTTTAPAPPESSNTGFYGVSCASTTSCIAVGLYMTAGVPRPLAESWDGSEWTLLPDAFEAGGFLPGVSCTSTSSCTAVSRLGTGSSGVLGAVRWDGEEWSALGAPVEMSAGVADVSCVSADACLAVSGNSPQAQVWDGSQWVLAAAPAPAGGSTVKLYDVSCAAAASCMASGFFKDEAGKTVALAERWDGDEWIARQPPGPEASATRLNGIDCAAATRCTAVGYDIPKAGEYATLAERYGTLPPTATTKAAIERQREQRHPARHANPQGAPTSYWFEYGTSTSYGTKLPLSPQALGSGAEDVSVSHALSGLTPSTTYHFRLRHRKRRRPVLGAERPSRLKRQKPKRAPDTGTSAATKAAKNSSIDPACSDETEGGEGSYGLRIRLLPGRRCERDLRLRSQLESLGRPDRSGLRNAGEQRNHGRKPGRRSGRNARRVAQSSKTAPWVAPSNPAHCSAGPIPNSDSMPKRSKPKAKPS